MVTPFEVRLASGLPSNHNEIFENALSSYCSENKETIILGEMNVDYLKQNDNNEFKMLLTFTVWINASRKKANSSNKRFFHIN